MKIAIVTGASSGMGREFVRQLADYLQVEEIWAIARGQEAVGALKSETPVPVRPIVLDLLEKNSFDKIRTLLETEQPEVRLLVNAAGFGKFGAYHRTSIEDDCRMIDLNCKALLVMTRLCIPYSSRAAAFWSWTACPPFSRYPTSPPTAQRKPSS